MCIRLDTIPILDRETDGQTDGRTDGRTKLAKQYRALRA